MNNLQSKVLSVIAWFFGVVFIFGGLGVLFGESLIGGLLMLVAGILLLPPIKRLILAKKPNLSKVKITVAGAVLAFISTFFIPTDENQDLTSESVDTETEVDAVKPEPTQKAEIKNFPEYKIVEDTVKRNIKRTVEVELSSRMDEETLIALAEKIYAMSDAKVERTFIFYRLANGSDGSAWATTHYNPEFKVDIVGATASDYERIKNTNISKGEEIGSWMASRGMDSKVTAYKKDGQVYIQELYDFGPLSKEDRVYESTELNEGIKLQSENDKNHNEYYIINKKGDLEFWSDNGNYYTAPKISDGKPEQTQVKSEEVTLEKPVEVIEEAPSKPSVTEKRQDIDPIKARAILEEVDQEVRAAKGFNLENKAEIAKKSRRMIALTKDTTPFGNEKDTIGIFCSIAPTEALLYWYEVMSTRTDPQRVKELLKNYQESKKTCLDAIKDFENS